jgi:hypothetical protein
LVILPLLLPLQPVLLLMLKQGNYNNIALLILAESQKISDIRKILLSVQVIYWNLKLNKHVLSEYNLFYWFVVTNKLAMVLVIKKEIKFTQYKYLCYVEKILVESYKNNY